MKFEDFKTEVLKRAKEQKACTYEYKAASESKDFEQLFSVLKRNFAWGRSHKIITPELIEQVKEEAAVNDMFVNVSTDKGYLLAYS